MSKYFDLEKLKEMVEAKAETLIEGKQAFLYVSKWLDILPAADVEPVRHGHWIYIGTDKTDNIFTCSECGRRIKNPCYETTAIVKIRFPYCNCGAKMDGKETEE